MILKCVLCCSNTNDFVDLNRMTAFTDALFTLSCKMIEPIWIDTFETFITGNEHW